MNKYILQDKNNNKKFRKKRDVNYKRISKIGSGAGWQGLNSFYHKILIEI